KSAVQNNKKPAEGQKVTFTVGRDAKGRLRAENVTIGKNATKIEQVRSQTKGRIGLPDLGSRGIAEIGSTRLLLFAIPFLAAALTLSWIPLAIYVSASVVGFGAITLDKRFAQEDMWRIPEATLHLIELLGGWPGSGAAQQIVRHKTQKISYQITFWLIAAVHLLIGIDYFLFGFQLSQMLADTLSG
ncbi:MAG: DUF1294 domain-containing protein, partial [Chloroflexota bacterium]